MYGEHAVRERLTVPVLQRIDAYTPASAQYFKARGQWYTSDPQPGDVAVNAEHCGIYIGGGQMIHAADYGIGVIVGPVQSGMIYVRY